MLIELLIFAFYTFTLLILMFKSRFSTIGQDQSGQFEPYFIGKIVNEIIKSIPFEKFKNKDKFVKFWTNNPETIDVIGADIQIKLSEEDCNQLYQKWYLKEYPYIKQENATEWLNTRLIGKITKFKLDQQRVLEINNSDFLQNTNIIYHTESLLEMQVLCLIVFSFLGIKKEVTMLDKEKNSMSGEASQSLQLYLALLLEHIFAYIASNYRKWEIARYGA